MINISTVEKRSRTTLSLTTDRALVAKPSVVIVEVPRTEVASVERLGNNALIRTKTGKSVMVEISSAPMPRA